MSIRPVDYTSLIPKSQEVTKIKQVESDKFRIQVEQGALQQEKQIDKNFKRVRDTSKSENLTVDSNKSNGNKQNSGGNMKQKKKEKDQVQSKEELGGTIDIKI